MFRTLRVISSEISPSPVRVFERRFFKQRNEEDFFFYSTRFISFRSRKISVPIFYRVGCRNSDIAMASTRNAAQAGNNSELSGNESAVYLGKASLATRSGNVISSLIDISFEERKRKEKEMVARWYTRWNVVRKQSDKRDERKGCKWIEIRSISFRHNFH